MRAIDDDIKDGLRKLLDDRGVPEHIRERLVTNWRELKNIWFGKADITSGQLADKLAAHARRMRASHG